MPEFQRAKKIFVYLSTEREPDTAMIIEKAKEQGTSVFVPVCVDAGEMTAAALEGARMGKNRYNIEEPVYWEREEAPENIDFAVVPCVSAGRDMKRLGHGGGYYDRFLSRTKAFKACICFEALLSDGIETDGHDIKMDCVITEREVYR